MITASINQNWLQDDDIMININNHATTPQARNATDGQTNVTDASVDTKDHYNKNKTD